MPKGKAEEPICLAQCGGKTDLRFHNRISQQLVQNLNRANRKQIEIESKV
jgi:hypothetical protein